MALSTSRLPSESISTLGPVRRCQAESMPPIGHRRRIHITSMFGVHPLAQAAVEPYRSSCAHFGPTDPGYSVIAGSSAATRDRSRAATTDGKSLNLTPPTAAGVFQT